MRYQVIPSDRDIAEPYRKGDFVPGEIPNLRGGAVKHDYNDKWTDLRLKDIPHSPETLLAPSNFLKWLHPAPVSAESPCDREHLKICPIEVLFIQDVLEEMIALAVKVCADGQREVMGWLGGRINMDKHGRRFTLITKQLTDKRLIGEPDSVNASVEIIGRLRHEIRESGNDVCGFWHSHPGYRPFLSDQRTWTNGRDVQSTHDHCRNWWDTSVVVDPYCGDFQSGFSDQAMVACYKISHEDESIMGFHSVSFGVIPTEQAKNQDRLLHDDDEISDARDIRDMKLNDSPKKMSKSEMK